MTSASFYTTLVRRGWWLVALAMLAALNVGLLNYYLATPIYRSSSQFIVTPANALTDDRVLVDSMDTLDRRSIVSTYAEVLGSRTIFQQAVADLRLEQEVADDYNVNAVVLPETNVLQITVTGPHPQVAALLVDRIGANAIAYIEGLSQVYSMTVLDPATVPDSPDRPRPLQDITLAVGVGALAGLVVAFLYAQPRVIRLTTQAR